MQKGLEEKLDAELEKENKKIFIVIDEIKKSYRMPGAI